jgi:hypothetical protein
MPHHHEPPPPHHMTPVTDAHYAYPPPPQPQSVYPSASYVPGPASSSFSNMQKRKQMRATQVCPSTRQMSCALLTDRRPANSVDNENRNVMKAIHVRFAKNRI